MRSPKRRGRRGLAPTLLDAVALVNERQVAVVLRHIEERAGELHGTRAAVLGLAFKPGTDDVRESPAIALTNALCSRGATVVCHDPLATAKARSRARPARPLRATTSGKRLPARITPWSQRNGRSTSKLDARRMRATMRGRLLFDARNCMDAEPLRLAGLEYAGIGRSDVHRPVRA